MGAGFIFTIVLLAALLGMFARQALATSEDNVVEVEREEDDTPHFHAM